MCPSEAEAYVAARTRGVTRAVAPWFAGLCLGMAAVYVFLQPRQPWAVFASVLTVAGLAELALLPALRAVPTRGLDLAGFLAVLVPQMVGLGFVALIHDPAQAVVIVISLLGAAYCMPSIGCSLLVTVLTLTGWAALARHDAPVDWLHWGFNLTSTAGIATAITAARVRELRSQCGIEADLRRASEDARAATRAKSEFLATMSHELRTPLHGIFGMTDVALGTADPEERRLALGRVRSCGRTLLALVDDILDVSRIEAGQLTLVRAHFAPATVLEAVVERLRPEAARKGLALVGEVDDRVPAAVLGDAARLRQILANLGGNAVKFTERGRVTIRLEVVGPTAPAPDEPFVLRGVIEDTGIGIAADQHDAVFELFTQVDGSATRRFGGTGLGLAIVRRLTTLMGGEVALDSTPGQGSRFSFTVRLTAADAGGARRPARGDAENAPPTPFVPPVRAAR